MKPLSELTVEDLAEAKVWEYKGGEDPQAFVSATPIGFLSEADPRVFLAATRFTLVSGEECFGYCSPQDSSGLDYLQPVLVFNKAHIPLHGESGVDQGELVSMLESAGFSLDQVFPVKMECLVQVDGESVLRVIGLEDILVTR